MTRDNESWCKSYRVTVILAVRNLCDTEYRDFLDTYKGYALSPGRDIRVSLSMPFR